MLEEYEVKILPKLSVPRARICTGSLPGAGTATRGKQMESTQNSSRRSSAWKEEEVLTHQPPRRGDRTTGLRRRSCHRRRPVSSAGLQGQRCI